MDKQGSKLSSIEEDYGYMRSICQGDQEAISALYQKYHVRLKRYLYQFSGDVATAEDVAQETFIRVVEKSAQFGYKGSVLGWIYSIGRNLSLNRIRSSKRAPHTSLNVSVGMEEGAPERQDLVQAQTDNASQMMDKQTVLSSIHEALLNVPEEFRDVLVLFDMEGYTYKEISEMLDCPMNTVASRLSRGRKHLAKQLEWAKGVFS